MEFINGVPSSFDLSARFCYFLNLNDSKIPEHKNLYNAVMNRLINPAASLLSINKVQPDNEVITSAINFLKNIAQSERNKEIKIIEKYINDLKKNDILAALKGEEKKNLDQILQELYNFSKNPEAGDFHNFYDRLITFINIIKNNLESYQQRLQILTENSNSSNKINSKSENIYFRLDNDIDSLIKNYYNQSKQSKQDSFIGIIRKNILSFIEKRLKNNKLFINNPVPILATIMTEFYNFLEPEYKKLISQYTIEQLEKELDKKFNEYASIEGTFLQKLLNEQEEILEIVDLMKETIHYKPLEDIENISKNTKNLVTNNEKKPRKKNKIKVKNSTEAPQFMTWSIEGNSNGFLYEIATMLREQGIKIEGTPATDVLTIDLAKLTVIPKEISDETKNIKESLEYFGKISNERKDRFTNLMNSYQQANAKIRASTQKINELLKENKIAEDIFIYHESLKLYQRIEENNTNKFHGRQLNIINALDSLYTANNISGLSLINPELLYGIVVNLANFAIGHELKGDVENYLSIFSGLLMFDDIQNIAKDAAEAASQQIESDYGQAYNIHLYLLNNIYIPGSLLLTSIATALSEGYNQITSDAGAYVKINTPNFNMRSSKKSSKTFGERIESYGFGINTVGDTEDAWNAVSQMVADNTKIQITFLTSFFQLISSLNSYLS